MTIKTKNKNMLDSQMDIFSETPLIFSDEARAAPNIPWPKLCPVVQSKQKFMRTVIITFNPHNPPLTKWLN